MTHLWRMFNVAIYLIWVLRSIIFVNRSLASGDWFNTKILETTRPAAILFHNFKWNVYKTSRRLMECIMAIREIFEERIWNQA